MVMFVLVVIPHVSFRYDAGSSSLFLVHVTYAGSKKEKDELECGGGER